MQKPHACHLPTWERVLSTIDHGGVGAAAAGGEMGAAAAGGEMGAARQNTPNLPWSQV